MPRSKAARALQVAADALFLLCFGAIVLRMLAKGSVYIENMPAQPSNRAALLVGLVWLGVLLGANHCMRRFAHTVAGRFFADWRGAMLAFALLLTAQMVIAHSCYTPCGWDPQVLLTTANDLLTGVPYTGTYFHQNPNNLFLLGCYRLLFAVLNRLGITNYLPWVVAVGSFLVWLSVLFLFLLVRRLFGARAAWLSFLLCAPMAALSPWITVPYSDTFGMPFAIGSVYFYVLARETKQPVRSGVWAAACGAWLALGARLKPTVLLIAIAAAVVELVCLTKQGRADNALSFSPVVRDKKASATTVPDFDEPAVAAIAVQETKQEKKAGAPPAPPQRVFAALVRRPLLRTTACLLLGIIVSYGACGWFQQRTAGKVLDPARAEQEKFSATHYFMMGFSQPYGSYAYEDMQYTESVKGSAAKTKANLDEAARRVREMGPKGYATFLWRKLLFNWTDGTFFFGREGAFYWGDAPQQTMAARMVQGVFRADKPGYGLLALWQQAQWVLCLLLMLCGVFYRSGKHAKWFWFARVCTLGLVCFLLVFEARSRYVYHFVPVLCFAALAGLFALLDALRLRKENPK